MIEAPGSRRQRNAGRTRPTAREERHNDQIVSHPVAYLIGDDQRRPRLVRIVGLSRCQHEPQLAVSWDREVGALTAPHLRPKLRLAAARRVDRQASRSEPSSGDSEY